MTKIFQLSNSYINLLKKRIGAFRVSYSLFMEGYSSLIYFWQRRFGVFGDVGIVSHCFDSLNFSRCQSGFLFVWQLCLIFTFCIFRLLGVLWFGTFLLGLPIFMRLEVQELMSFNLLFYDDGLPFL